MMSSWRMAGRRRQRSEFEIARQAIADSVRIRTITPLFETAGKSSCTVLEFRHNNLFVQSILKISCEICRSMGLARILRQQTTYPCFEVGCFIAFKFFFV